MEKETNRENEQTPEEILEVLESAAEKALKSKLTVSSLDGKSTNTNVVAPYSFEGDYVTVETDDGRYIIDIELKRIVRAGIIPQKEEK
jgi:hypothetical protein